ncbi:MAG: hypothetical protein ACFCU4_04825 [Puniceicoccaceae bacterium]
MNRSEIRRSIYRASKGSSQHFRAAVEPFINLVAECVTLANPGSVQSITNRSQEVFVRVWSQMPKLRRVSDLERLIVATLVADNRNKNSLPNGNHLLGRILRLNPMERCLVVLREMEGWDLKRICRACRLSPKELDKLLCEIRCRLVKFEVPEDPEERQRFLLISRSITTGSCCFQTLPKDRPERLRFFRDAWLEARGELIDLRQDMRFDGLERKWFLDGLEAVAQTRSPEPVRVIPALRNFFSFEPEMILKR